jgi:hypothetical protein
VKIKFYKLFPLVPIIIKIIHVFFIQSDGILDSELKTNDIPKMKGCSINENVTGYLGTACLNVTGATTNTNSTGFRIEPSDASVTSSSVRHGIATITNITGNTWCFASTHGHSNTNCSTYAGGSLALGGVLDRVRITTTNGTDTFDAGSINIQYEG